MPTVNRFYKMQNKCSKVILVEDNKAEADLTKIIFREQAIRAEIVHCNNGEDLLNLLSSIAYGEICYILLDLNMPKVNGFDILKAFSEHQDWSKLPVIVFTSSNSDADMRTCYEMGANAYVPKPLDLNGLDSTIKAIHDFWGETNVQPAWN